MVVFVVRAGYAWKEALGGGTGLVPRPTALRIIPFPKKKKMKKVQPPLVPVNAV